MGRSKIILPISLACILGCYILLHVIVAIKGYPIVIGGGMKNSSGASAGSMDSIINPISNLDFDDGKWRVYLAIESYDLEGFPDEMKKNVCLKLSDREIMKEMQHSWNFIHTGGDMATVDSSVFFLKDGTLQFKSGIVIDRSNPGLQTPCCGWIVPADKDAFLNSLLGFRRKVFPVIITK